MCNQPQWDAMLGALTRHEPITVKKFSRESSRLFGTPLLRDIINLRQMAAPEKR